MTPLRWHCGNGHDRGIVPTSAAFTLKPCVKCGDGIWVTPRLATPPPALDVERLARAIAAIAGNEDDLDTKSDELYDTPRELARQFAAEYRGEDLLRRIAGIPLVSECHHDDQPGPYCGLCGARLTESDG